MLWTTRLAKHHMMERREAEASAGSRWSERKSALLGSSEKRPGTGKTRKDKEVNRNTKYYLISSNLAEQQCKLGKRQPV